MVLCSRSGPMEIMNSQRLRSRQATATSSRLALSRIQMPMAVMPTWWMGLGTFSYCGRVHVVARVGAQHGDATLVEQRKARRLAGRRTGLPRPRALNVSAVELAGADQQHVALLHLETALLLGGKDVVDHHALAPVDPVDTL